MTAFFQISTSSPFHHHFSVSEQRLVTREF